MFHVEVEFLDTELNGKKIFLAQTDFPCVLEVEPSCQVVLSLGGPSRLLGNDEGVAP